MKENINTNTNVDNTTNTENTNTSNGGFFLVLYILGITFLVASLVGVITEFVEDTMVSEEKFRGFLIAALNFCVQKHYFDKHMREFKEKKEKEEKEEPKKMIEYDPKKDKYFFLVPLFFSLVYIGFGIYACQSGMLSYFSDLERVLMQGVCWISGSIFFLLTISARVEYIAEIKPDFRKKLPQWWQKRIEDIMKPKEVTSEENSLEEGILKFRKWLDNKLS